MPLCAVHTLLFDTKAAAWPNGAGKRRWAPQTTRDTPEGEKKPSIHETELMLKVLNAVD